MQKTEEKIKIVKTNNKNPSAKINNESLWNHAGRE